MILSEFKKHKSSLISRRPGDGWIIGSALFGLAYVGYVLGFLSLGRTYYDAFSIAFSHVLPATVCGAIVWQLQPRIRKSALLARLVLHVIFAAGFGLLWAGGLALIAWMFAPEVLPRLLDEILVWTAITGVLVYAFLASISSIFSIRRRTLELDASAARTELSALRARLEPHFLYNTLESISGLVRSNPDAAEDAIARLGHALRRLLDGRSEEGGPTPDRLVSVAEELAFVRDTLFIEKLRMGDRLKLVESIDPNTLELAIPALTLQPLVQNAIQHGLSGKREGGTLSIVSRLDGGDLVLEVADDGVGTDEQTIAKAKGLGLDHLRRRLLGHFGNRASINVAASPEFGVSVQISVPAVEA